MQRKAAASALFNTVGKGPTGVIKSVRDTQRTDGGRRDEIFVDIVERISCTFNQTGYVTASQIDGAIQVTAHIAAAVLLYKGKLSPKQFLAHKDVSSALTQSALTSPSMIISYHHHVALGLRECLLV